MKTDRWLPADFWRKNGLLLLLLCAGLVLLLLPGRRAADTGADAAVSTEEETRLASVLGRMEGVGEVAVLLAKGPGRNDGFTGAVIVCQGARDPATQLRIVEAVSAFTGLGSNRIVVQTMIS